MREEDLIGLTVGFFILVVFPSTWILLHHQRKMAELIHGSPQVGDGTQERLTRVEQKLEDIRQLMLDQAIELDDRRPTLPTSDDAG